ncbi:MAG: NAD(+)/NADH kinase [Bacteroidota bacterium]
MKFGIAGNLEKQELPRVAAGLIRRCREENIEFVLPDAIASAVRRVAGRPLLRGAEVVRESRLPDRCDMIISLGGDGTILRLARLVGSRGTPILGVNLGKLGFLAEVSLEELDECVTGILEGKFVLEERLMLEMKVKGSGETFLALNDVVIEKYGTPRVMSIEASVNGEYLATYAADGLIIATPTGSTGYSLANGGPIVAPATAAITISPICPHTLTARPVLVPDNSIIRVKATYAARKVHVTADGQLELLLRPPAEIQVKRAPFSARLVKRPHTSYFDVLRKKLNWGKDVRHTRKGMP